MEKHKHGGDIYSREIEMDYSANISPLGLPRRSMEAIRASLERLVHYPDVECRSLRAMLSEKAGIPARFYPLRKRSGRADLRTGKRMQTEEGSGGGTRLCRVRTGTFRLRL